MAVSENCPFTKLLRPLAMDSKYRLRLPCGLSVLSLTHWTKKFENWRKQKNVWIFLIRVNKRAWKNIFVYLKFTSIILLKKFCRLIYLIFILRQKLKADADDIFWLKLTFMVILACWSVITLLHSDTFYLFASYRKSWNFSLVPHASQNVNIPRHPCHDGYSPHAMHIYVLLY